MDYFFRVDSDSNIGAGHYERCYTLAKNLSKKFKVNFISANLTLNQKKKLKKTKIGIIKINNFSSISSDATHTAKIIKKGDVLIVDGYKFNNYWISFIKKKTKNIFINNDFENKFNCTIINPSKIFVDHVRNKFGIPIIKRNFLVDNFERQFYQIKKSKTILLCLGGSDKENYSEKIIDILSSSKLKKFKIRVILGELNTNFENINKKFKRNKNISIKKNIKNLTNIYSKSALCILAGGTMSREAITFGIPSIIFKVSLNQEQNINFYKKNKIYECFNINNINKINKNLFINKLIKNINTFNFSNFLKIISFSGYDYLDRYLFLLSNRAQKPAFKLKQTSWKDFIFLFNLANQNRRKSFSKKKIDILEHYNWFKKKISSINSKNYILYNNDIKLGQIRLDKKYKDYYIDYSIDKFYQGNGYGKIIVKLLLSKFRSKNYNIYAKVLNTNFKSKKVFTPLCVSFKKNYNKKTIIFKLK